MAYDAVAVNITALFEVAVLGSLYRYLCQRWRAGSGSSSITPASFLLSSIIVGGLSLLFLAFLGPQNGLLAFALGLGTLISLVHPVVATSFFLANLFLRPWELLPSNAITEALTELLAIVCLLSWLLNRLKKRQYHMVWNRTCTWFLLLLGWFIIAALMSPSPTEALGFLFSSFFPIVVVALLVVNNFEEKMDLEAACYSLILAISGAISTAIYVTLQKGEPRLDAGGTLYGNANDLASLIVLVMPFAAMLLWRRGRKVSRPLAGVLLVAILLFGLWLSQSRGAILSLGLSGFSYFLFCVKKSFRTNFLLIGGVLGVVVLMSSLDRKAEDMEGSSESRMNYAVAGFRMLKSNPLFGVGLNMYPKRYEQFSSNFNEYGERTAHSSWVLVMSETGVFGLVLFVALFVHAFRLSLKIRHQRPEFLMSLSGYGLAMSFLSHTYIAPPYLLYSLILAASRVLRQKQA